MKKLMIIIAAVGALMIQSCTTSMKVVSDVDPVANFGSYKTFSIEYVDSNAPRDLSINEINQRRLEKAIIAEMEKRGYVLTEEADLKVSYQVNIKENKEYRTNHYNNYGPYYGGYYGYYGYGYGPWMYGGGGGFSTTNEYSVYNGKLTVKIEDSSEDKLVWLGSGKREITESNRRVEDRIKKDVADIFKQYPYAAGVDGQIKIKDLQS
ncbi:DUF4136 domain-containing protein [Flexithrix dorotheae]|uniref:DUF4136 domain-containing protein n=1 Tax=Flexithrix dorotheae TaxID=70993 RepID=UPI0003692632|nr:DUF4136 domain-containing protein [Flexithrix dorotheae]